MGMIPVPITRNGEGLSQGKWHSIYEYWAEQMMAQGYKVDDLPGIAKAAGETFPKDLVNSIKAKNQLFPGADMSFQYDTTNHMKRRYAQNTMEGPKPQGEWIPMDPSEVAQLNSYYNWRNDPKNGNLIDNQFGGNAYNAYLAARGGQTGAQASPTGGVSSKSNAAYGITDKFVQTPDGKIVTRNSLGPNFDLSAALSKGYKNLGTQTYYPTADGTYTSDPAKAANVPGGGVGGGAPGSIDAQIAALTQQLTQNAALDSATQQFNLSKNYQQYNEGRSINQYLTDLYGQVMGVNFPSTTYDLSNYFKNGAAGAGKTGPGGGSGTPADTGDNLPVFGGPAQPPIRSDESFSAPPPPTPVTSSYPPPDPNNSPENQVSSFLGGGLSSMRFRGPKADPDSPNVDPITEIPTPIGYTGGGGSPIDFGRGEPRDPRAVDPTTGVVNGTANAQDRANNLSAGTPGGAVGGYNYGALPIQPANYSLSSTSFNPYDSNTWALLAKPAQEIGAGLTANKKSLLNSLPQGGARDLAMGNAINSSYGQIAGLKQGLVGQSLTGLSNLGSSKEFGQPLNSSGAASTAANFLSGQQQNQTNLTGIAAGQQNSSNSMWGTVLGAVAGALLSDVRTKEDVKPFSRGLSALLKLDPVSFDYNGEGGSTKGERGISVMAQDLEKIIPEAVIDGPTHKSIIPMGILMTAVNSIKDLEKKVKKLEKKGKA